MKEWIKTKNGYKTIDGFQSYLRYLKKQSILYAKQQQEKKEELYEKAYRQGQRIKIPYERIDEFKEFCNRNRIYAIWVANEKTWSVLLKDNEIRLFNLYLNFNYSKSTDWLKKFGLRAKVDYSQLTAFKELLNKLNLYAKWESAEKIWMIGINISTEKLKFENLQSEFEKAKVGSLLV